MPHKMQKAPLLLSNEKIWDHAEHSALTDLIQFQGKFFCIFRESDSHYAGVNGILRLLVSSNGVVWSPLETFEWEGWDLRDPHLCVMPNGKLQLIAGASIYASKDERTDHCSITAFSEDGKRWTPFKTIAIGEEWLWRILWHKGKGYGVSYYFLDPANPKGSWGVKLYETSNGIDYKEVTQWPIPGKPNETSLQFLSSDQMVALVRRNGPGQRNAWIGTSFPPYIDWLWSETNHYIGGPAFIVMPSGKMWAGGRVAAYTPYGAFAKMALWDMTLSSLEPVLILPSFGDCSYPGMVYDAPYLWMSYYSSHQGKASIYLAKFLID